MHLAGGLGSLLEIRCSRTPIIVNIISQDDSSNEIHVKRLRFIIATCSRNTVQPDPVRLPGPPAVGNK